MAFAVSLLFNSQIASAISACWKLLADAGISSSMLDLKYPPHVTLGVYDELAMDAAVAALDRVFPHVDQIALTFARPSTFGSGTGVLYFAHAPSPDVIR